MFTPSSLLCLGLSGIFLALTSPPAGGAEEAPAFRIENTVVLTSPPGFYFTQSRAAVIPGSPARILITTQETERTGAHGYRDVFHVESSDGGHTWSPPKVVESLRRSRQADGFDVVIGDVWPRWHEPTGVVLATGKTFNFRDGAREDRSRERVSYAIFDPAQNAWSGLRLVDLPATDHSGQPILQPNAGCNQRFDLPDGSILLPVRYGRKAGSQNYTTIVARCEFDGKQLVYKEHGSELTLPEGRGLYEPSVTGFQGRYFLTMRADRSAYVASGQDGIHYGPVQEWKFDDGEVLGSYSTQQHWVTRDDGLYLVFTRRGAGNDHIFRHRAPLFIAKVDAERLCVLRRTEQVLIPEEGADLGNFGVVDISPGETWVITSESPGRLRETNRVLVARLLWTKPGLSNPQR